WSDSEGTGMKFLRRLGYWLQHSRQERELAEEIEFHRSQIPDARLMGNTTLAREDARSVWIWPWLQNVWQDASYAVRGMRKNPAFALTAILSLALGIGGNTAIFTVVNAVLLKPLPFPEPGRLVQLWESKPAKGYHRNVVNGVNFLDWRELTHSFEEM